MSEMKNKSKMNAIMNKNKSNNNKIKSNKKIETKSNGKQTINNEVFVLDLVTDSETTETEEELEEPEDWMSSETTEKPKKESKIEFKFCGAVKSDLERPLYGVQFNTFLPKTENYFATIGSNRVTIYECLSNGSIRLVQCYSDSFTEELYTCVWSFDDLSGNPLLISAGKRGIIRIIDCGAYKSSRHLIGHGFAVNELKISPHDSNLLLSSSKDYTLRLWNIKTNVCVIKFGGESGHRDQVISADFYLLSNKYIVSTGMDHSIKIWSLDTKDIKKAITESYDYKSEDDSFPMHWQHFPVFNTRKIHTNYVDCVQFFGKFVLSKSCCNEIICSKPTLLDTENHFPDNKISEEISSIECFALKDTNYWFIKFSMDSQQRLLSVGNDRGLTYVWDMTVDNPFDYEPLVLERKKCESVIRQTCFSSDGSILICVCDDSTIWRWDRTHT